MGVKVRKIVVVIIVLGIAGLIIFLYNLPAYSPSSTPSSAQILVMPFEAQGLTENDTTLNAGPDIPFEEVATIDSESAIKIIGVSVDLKWYLVEYVDTQGQVVYAWVSAESITITYPPSELNPTPDSTNPNERDGGEVSPSEEETPPPEEPIPPTEEPEPTPDRDGPTVVDVDITPDVTVKIPAEPTLLPINLPINFGATKNLCLEGRPCLPSSWINGSSITIPAQVDPFSPMDSVNPFIFFSLTKTSIPFYVPPTLTKPPFAISPTIIKPLFITLTYTKPPSKIPTTKTPFIISLTATKPPPKTSTTKPPYITSIIKPPPITSTTKPPPTKYPIDTKPPPIPTSTPKLILKPTSTSKFGPTPTLSK